jgi:uncharacterized protein YkwD
MLQRTSISMSLLVLALAGPGVATAQTDGQTSLDTEAKVCLEQALPASGLDIQLLAIANKDRAGLSLSELQPSESLAATARAHARDMALSGYVSYTDASGRSLLDQVRLSDRTALISSFGSSIAVLDAGATAEEIHAAILSDPANAEMLRRGFSHAGTGTYEFGGRIHVVQLFARIDGTLKQPLPASLTYSELITPKLENASMTPVGWSLSDAQGELLARGNGRRILSSDRGPVAGYLNLDVAVGTDVYTLRGPFVEVN